MKTGMTSNPWTMDHGPWAMGHGHCLMVHGLNFMNHKAKTRINFMSSEEEKERMRNIAGIDQNISMAADTFPLLWWKMYKGCMDQGFSEAQAMDLIKTFIHGSQNK